MMSSKEISLLSFFLFAFVTAGAQTAHVLTNDPSLTISGYPVLPDHHYSLSQVLSDTSLHFRRSDSLDTRQAGSYWARIVVDNPYPNNERYDLFLTLPLNYILYFPHAEQNSWSHRVAGPGTAGQQLEAGRISCVLQAGERTVFYLKMDMRDLQAYGYAIRPGVVLEKKIVRQAREQRTWIIWLACVTLLGFFFCYNLYVYRQLRDKVYLCYLMVQVGAGIYITAYRHFFNLLPFTWYNVRLNPDGSMCYYNLNALLLHAGGMVLMPAIIQLTRFYLCTRERMPVYDRLLQLLAYGYIVYALVPALVTISGLYYLDNFTLFPENVFILLILILVVLTSAVAYRRRISAARHFLLANILPFALAGSTAIYFIVYPTPAYSNMNSFLPEIAILSQLITIAVALLARLRIMKEELQWKEQEMRKLEEDIALTEYKHMLLEQEHQLITAAMKRELRKD